jgi:lipopolysaccharide export system protein LptC
MRRSASALFPIALMLSLSALTYWLDLTVNESGGVRERQASAGPDFIIDDFRVTRLNQAGHADYVLTAKRMEHFRDDDLTRVASPSLVHYAPDAPPVRVDAQRGVVTGNGDVTEFYDNVMVSRGAAGGEPALLVSTDYLKVLPDAATASTDHEVTITQGRSVLSGKGLEYDNRTRVFHLLGQVRGRFQRER